MFSLFWSFSLRYLRRHWGRSLLVVLSIALGVGTWIATDALNLALQRAVRDSISPPGQGAQLIIDNPDTGIVNAALRQRIASVPGVRAVVPWIRKSITLSSDGSAVEAELLASALPERGQETGSLAEVGVNLEAIDWQAALAAQRLGIPRVLLGRSLHQKLLRGKNGRLILHIDAREHEVWCVGAVEPRGSAASLGGATVLMFWEEAAVLLGRPGHVHSLNVTLQPGVEPRQARQTIQQAVGDLAYVQTPEDQDARIKDLFKGLESGFRLCGVGAAVVGLCLVFMALSVTVAERRHDVGVLRSSGATRTQVRLLFLGEAILLGLLGSLLGVPLGLGLAQASLEPMQQLLVDMFGPMHAGQLQTTPRLILSAIATGLATAILAALIPASQAASEEPADAVRRAPVRCSFAYRLMQIATSIVLMLWGCGLISFKLYLTPELIERIAISLAGTGALSLGAAGLALRQTEQASGPGRSSLVLGALTLGVGILAWLLRFELHANSANYLGLFLILLGLTLATPLLAAGLIHLTVPLFKAVLPLESRLAADNLVRSSRRTGLVITVLAGAIGLIFQTAGVIRSNEAAVRRWIAECVRADLYLTSGGPLNAANHTRTMTGALDEQLRRILPTGTVLVGRCERKPNWNVPVRLRGPLTLSLGQNRDLGSLHPASPGETTAPERGTQIFLTLLDASAYYQANRERPGLPAQTLDLYRRLGSERGTVIVSDNFARLYGLRAGDVVTLKGTSRPVPLTILGTVVDYTWNRGSLFVDRQLHRDDFNAEAVDAWEIYLPAGCDAEQWRGRLLRSPVGAKHALFSMTNAELREHLFGLVKRLYGMAYTQETVVAVVAIFGVMTALLISVLGRRRELGVLRAVGATRAQVIHTVVAEAALIGLFGTLIGLFVGLPLEWFVVKVIVFEETGFVYPLHLPWTEALLIALVAVAGATLAGLLPAIHAMRLRIADAIAYE